MTIDEAADDIVRRIEFAYGGRRGQHTATAVALTGEPYVLFGHAGKLAQGDPVPTSPMEIEDLIEHAVSNVLDHFKGVPVDQGIVYWRVRPRIEANSPTDHRVRLRVLISPKAAVAEATEGEKAFDVMKWPEMV